MKGMEVRDKNQQRNFSVDLRLAAATNGLKRESHDREGQAACGRWGPQCSNLKDLNPANNPGAWEKSLSLRWEHGLAELLFQPSETLSPPGKQNWGKLLI